jgi:hypothetical protein
MLAGLLGTSACASSSTMQGASPAAPASAAAPLMPATTASDDSTYDIVIRNGRVLDGAGNPWIRADVGIRNGRFARIGVIHGHGRTELDATGQYVSPGWIDMMDQSGGVLPRNPLAENKLMMGVTTAIGGEGGTPVPASQIPAYFRRLETQGISINFGSYFSETQARVPVLGMSARAPTPAELERMRAIMDTAMRNGAMGMTTALIYPPSSYATTDELAEVAKAIAPYGGIYASHIRGEGAEVVDAVSEAIHIGERAGTPVEVFHLKVADQPSWGKLMNVVRDTVEAARARGVDVAADMYVYTAGGTGLEATIPSWAHEGGTDSLKKRLADPAIRARLKRELTTGSPGWWNIISAAGGWDGVVLANARNPENAKYVGKSIAQIAKETGKDPADAAWNIVAAGKGTRDGHLPHDGRAGHRDGAALPVDEHRQRCRRRARRGAGGWTRPAAPAQLRQRRARDREVREGAAGADAAGSGAEDDLVASDPDAPRQPWHDQGRPLGRRHDLRSRHAQGQRDVRPADAVAERDRLGAGERRRRDRPRPAHRSEAGAGAARPGRAPVGAGGGIATTLGTLPARRRGGGTSACSPCGHQQ